MSTLAQSFFQKHRFLLPCKPWKVLSLVISKQIPPAKEICKILFPGIRCLWCKGKLKMTGKVRRYRGEIERTGYATDQTFPTMVLSPPWLTPWPMTTNGAVVTQTSLACVSTCTPFQFSLRIQVSSQMALPALHSWPLAVQPAWPRGGSTSPLPLQLVPHPGLGALLLP